MCTAVVVVLVLVLFDDFSAQQMDIILNAMNKNTIRIVSTIPIKYGVESCELATIKFSVKDRAVG